jgi:hypothetical protein
MRLHQGSQDKQHARGAGTCDRHDPHLRCFACGLLLHGWAPRGLPPVHNPERRAPWRGPSLQQHAYCFNLVLTVHSHVEGAVRDACQHRDCTAHRHSSSNSYFIAGPGKACEGMACTVTGWGNI